MSDLKSPSISNPNILIPVNPAIEDYMRGLLGRTDHPVLIEMELLAQKKEETEEGVVLLVSENKDRRIRTYTDREEWFSFFFRRPRIGPHDRSQGI